MRTIVLALLFVAASAQAEIYSKARDSIAIVTSDESICTAFIVDDQHLISAAHCFRYFHNVEVMWFDMPGLYEPVEVIAKDVHTDLALLRFKNTRNKPSLQLRDPAKPLQVEEEVYAIGHPLQSRWDFARRRDFEEDSFTFAKGLVSKVVDGMIKSQIPIEPGFSGGPLLDKDGRVAGMNSQGNYNYGKSIDSKTIAKFLNENKLRTSALGWSDSKHSFNLQFWATYQSYLHRLNRPADLHYIGLTFDAYDRFRVLLGGNGGEHPLFTKVGLGWKFTLISPNSRELDYVYLGLEGISYNLTPQEKDDSKKDVRRGTAPTVEWSSGSSGLALQLAFPYIESRFESIIGISIFF